MSWGEFPKEKYPRVFSSQRMDQIQRVGQMILPGQNYRKRKHTKLIHEGEYVAKVDVELIDTVTGWSPYLLPQDVQKLDEVREALRKGDLKAASRLARIYTLKPVDSTASAA